MIWFESLNSYHLLNISCNKERETFYLFCNFHRWFQYILYQFSPTLQESASKQKHQYTELENSKLNSSEENRKMEMLDHLHLFHFRTWNPLFKLLKVSKGTKITHVYQYRKTHFILILMNYTFRKNIEPYLLETNLLMMV